ncbi:MAG: DUF6285 domain-containing protein [Acidimicrobiales bacterium]
MNDAPHDAPGIDELLDAVEQFLRQDLLPTVEGRMAFLVRVSANVVSMVARQVELGPEQAGAHVARLRSFGVDSERALAEAIRSGSFDDRLDEVTAAVRATVADKLAVANPRYIEVNDR